MRLGELFGAVRLGGMVFGMVFTQGFISGGNSWERPSIGIAGHWFQLVF